MMRYKEIYRAEQLPVFQNRMFHSELDAKNCIKGDVVLVQDVETGLIFNQAFRPEVMQYDKDYQNEQAFSDIFRRHLDDVITIVESHFEALPLIEVGCGKGYFLHLLETRGFEVVGLDPTYEGTNPSVLKEYFSAESGVRAEGVILRHVLEHVEDPVTFLLNIRDSNGGSGKIYIEVPCLNWISARRAWFDIFYEHVNYFRPDDFDRIFGTVYESGHVFGGQYLYVVADLATIRMPKYNNGLFEFPCDFSGEIERYAGHLRVKHASTALGKGPVSAIWGGASKGVIFALFMRRAGAKIDLVIDINPAKQNKYMAATGLQIKSPLAAMSVLPAGSDLFVMNGNYLNEIRGMTGNCMNYILIDANLIDEQPAKSS